MLIGSIIVVLIGQGLLNYITNANYFEPMVAPHRAYSFTSEFITTIKTLLNLHLMPGSTVTSINFQLQQHLTSTSRAPSGLLGTDFMRFIT